MRGVSQPVLDVRRGLCRAQHLPGEVDAEHVALRPDLLRKLAREAPCAAGEVEGPTTGPEPCCTDYLPVPEAVESCGHNGIQEVVAAGDPVEHLPHQQRPLRPRRQPILTCSAKLTHATPRLLHGSSPRTSLDPP